MDHTRVFKASAVVVCAWVVQIKDKGYHAGKDTEFNSYVLDEDSEDKVVYTHTQAAEGGQNT